MLEEPLGRVLRSEHNHLVQLWDDAPHPQRRLMLALAEEPTPSVYSSDYQSRHDLPANPTLQTALAGLVHKEIVARNEPRPVLPHRAVPHGMARRHAFYEREGLENSAASFTKLLLDVDWPPKPR